MILQKKYQVPSSPEALSEALERDSADAYADLTRLYKAAEGRRRAIRMQRRRRHEKPRELTEDEIAEAVAATPDLPPFTISKKFFDRQFCKCLRYREAGKCD